MQATYEVADILRKQWAEIEAYKQINSWQLRTLSAIKICRTSALGGHKDACIECGTLNISYNSCRNRNCPKCQGKEREKWIEKRREELLPVKYFHVVFTLPDTLNQLAMYKAKEVYDALFKSAWDTLSVFAKDQKHLGAKTGMISILHTWGQQLTLHPHLHCIVPDGGLTKANKWKQVRCEGKFLFPVKAMSKVFRAKYVSILRSKIQNLDKHMMEDLFKKEWVVYAKRPFGTPEMVLEYLGRYTHKIAISNHRIKSIDDKIITIAYKDYRHENQKKELDLEHLEFVRRFSMHILPKGLVRIRHYGILSSTSKPKTIPIIKEQVKPEEKLPQYFEPRIMEPYNPLMCPHCKTETRVTIEIMPRRGPPTVIKRNQNSMIV